MWIVNTIGFNGRIIYHYSDRYTEDDIMKELSHDCKITNIKKNDEILPVDVRMEKIESNCCDDRVESLSDEELEFMEEI